MAVLEGHSVVALDGTGSFASKALHWASCRRKVHRNGSVTSYHPMLGAALVPPDMRAVMPLMPEALVPPDGTAKKAGERQAAHRLGAKLRQDHPHRTCIVTADRLRANAPPMETRHDPALHSLLGGKAGDQAWRCTQGQAAADAGRVTEEERHDRAAGLGHRLRLGHQVPLNAATADVPVNCIAYGELGAARVQHWRWGTDWRVTQRNVEALRRGGRARWKSANETFQTLQNQGEHCEHHDGHGRKNLSVVFATGMRLAFRVDQPQQLCCALFQAVWAKLGSKRLVWERMRALFYDYRLDSMHALVEARLYGFEKSRPLLSLDASSNAIGPLTCLLGNLLIPQRHGLRLSRARATVLRHGLSWPCGPSDNRHMTQMEV